jgi:hypothetical protein
MSYKPDGADILLGCGFVIADIPYRVWVASLLWGWFIVPLGVPVLGFWQMFGVLATLGLMVRHVPAKQTAEDNATWLGLMFSPIIMTTISLAIGVLLRGVMP